MGDKNPLETVVGGIAYPFQPGNAFGADGFFRSTFGLDGNTGVLGEVERTFNGDGYAQKETAWESMQYVASSFGYSQEGVTGRYHPTGINKTASNALGSGRGLNQDEMRVATEYMDRIHAVMMGEFEAAEGAGPDAAGKELVDAMLDLARFQSGEALTVGAEFGFLMSANDYIHPVPDGAQSEMSAMVTRINGDSETPSFGVDEDTGIPYRIGADGTQEQVQPQELMRVYSDTIAAEHGMDPDMLFTMLNVESANQGVHYLQSIPEQERAKYLQQAGTNIDTFVNNITDLNASLPNYFRTEGEPPRPQFDSINHIITEEHTRMQGLLDPLGQRETEKEIQEGIRDIMQEIKGFLLGLFGFGPKVSERSQEIEQERQADLNERFDGREIEALSLNELAEHLGTDEIDLGNTGIDPTTKVGDLEVDQLSQLADLNTDNPAVFAALATELSSRGQEGLTQFAEKIAEMNANGTLTQEMQDELGAYMQMHNSALANVYEQTPALRDDILQAAIEQDELGETLQKIGDQANPDLQAMIIDALQSEELGAEQIQMAASAISQLAASGNMEMVAQILEGLSVDQMAQLVPHLEGEALSATIDKMLENGAELEGLLSSMDPRMVGEYYASLEEEEAELAAEIMAYVNGLEASQQATFNMAASGVTSMSDAVDVQAQPGGEGQQQDAGMGGPP